MNSILDTYTLTNGVKIPCVGYGTWQTPSEITKESVRTALDVGYRHIDTAAAYGNEEAVGEGIRESGVNREDIFLTTKHWVMERGYTKTIAAVEASLKALNTDYLDLYLVHWPCAEKASPQWKEINAATWRAFEKMYRDGKIRALGVSNFLPQHLAALEETAEIRPMVNQIEIHPGYCQAELTQWCLDHGMVVEAWSPLGCGAVLSNPIVEQIAKAHGKSVAQVCLRFVLQQGAVPLTKSTHRERMIHNTEIFDFELTEAEMMTIRMMPPVGYSTYHPLEAPADTLFGANYDVE